MSLKTYAEIPQKISYEIDYKKLVANAEAAGFNPLTALRAGGGAGFVIEHHPSLMVPMGGFSADLPGYADEAPPVADAGGYFGGTSGNSDGGDSGSGDSGTGLDPEDALDWVEDITGGPIGGKTGVGTVSKSGGGSSGLFKVPTTLAPSVKVAPPPKTVIGAPAKPGVAQTAGPGAPKVTTGPSSKSSKTKEPEYTELKFGPGLTLEFPNYWEKGDVFEEYFGDFWGDLAMVPMALDTLGHNARRFIRWGTDEYGLPTYENTFGTTRPETRVQAVPQKGPGAKQVGTTIPAPFAPDPANKYGKVKPLPTKTQAAPKLPTAKTKTTSTPTTKTKTKS